MQPCLVEPCQWYKIPTSSFARPGEHTLRRGNERIAKQAPKWTPNGRKGLGDQRANGKKSGKRNGNDRLQIQLEEDDEGSSRDRARQRRVVFDVRFAGIDSGLLKEIQGAERSERVGL